MRIDARIAVVYNLRTPQRASEPAAGALAFGDLAKSLYASADMLDETGHSAEALAHYDETREVLERLPFTGPGSKRRRALLGGANSELGFVLAE